MQIFRSLGKYPIHSIAIIVFFLSHGYSENFGSIPINEMLIYFAKTIVIVSLLLFFLKKRLSSWIKAGLIITPILVFFFFYGAIQETLKSSAIFYWLAKYRILLPGIILFIVGLYYYLKKSNKSFAKVTLYLNVLMIVLIVLDIGKISVDLIQLKSNSEEKSELLSEMPPCDKCQKPDIYFILLDEYWGTDMLRKYFNYDNHSLDSFLSKNGFRVIPHPSSNYSVTPVSVASMFDMKYAAWLKDKDNVVAEDYGVVASKVITKSATIQFLKSLGYQINNCSIFDIEDKPAAYNFQVLPVKMRLITSKTFPAKVERDLLWIVRMKIASRYDWLTKKFQNEAREGNKEIIRQTVEVVNKTSTRPQFTYTHLLMPHLPCIYDSLGRDIFLNYYRTGLSGKQNDENYLQYLVYTNKQVMKIIGEIMIKSKGNAAVILMSDHGYRYFSSEDKSLSRFNNYNAVYLPSKDYHLFYDSMTNVNEFRTLFNSLFVQKLPMLKDSVLF